MTADHALMTGALVGALIAMFGREQVDALADDEGNFLPVAIVTSRGKRWRVTVEEHGGDQHHAD